MSFRKTACSNFQYRASHPSAASLGQMAFFLKACLQFTALILILFHSTIIWAANDEQIVGQGSGAEDSDLNFTRFLFLHYSSAELNSELEIKSGSEPAMPAIPEYTIVDPTLIITAPTAKSADINDNKVAEPVPAGTPLLAIIIDDIGNNRTLDFRTANLPGNITLAILPFTPHSQSTARLAHKKNKGIMLHAPMESLNHLKLGDGALTQDLSEQVFIKTLQSSIDAIPHISGLNNHMGSALTQNTQAMEWVMQAAHQNKLFFVDSRTTHKSVAVDLAKKHQVAHISRNIFLDNETEYDYIDESFNRAIAISKKVGFAVAIGHPYPATLSYLEEKLPVLKKQGVVLVSVSDLIQARARNRTTKNAKKN